MRDENVCHPYDSPPGIGYSMLIIVIGIGLYYNVIIAWIIYYLIELFMSIPRGRLPWAGCDNWCVHSQILINQLLIIQRYLTL